MCQAIYLSDLQSSLNKGNNFYLLFLEYSNIFNTLFFSSLSLICIAEANNSSDCIHFMNDISNIAFSENISNDIYSNVSNSDSIEDNTYSFFFINFTKLIFSQNEILYQNLNNKLQKIIEYLLNFDNHFSFNLNTNISHYKINQNINDDIISLSLKKEYFTFYEFLLLMTSRFGIIIKDIEYLTNPIYILNKTGDEIF